MLCSQMEAIPVFAHTLARHVKRQRHGRRWPAGQGRGCARSHAVMWNLFLTARSSKQETPCTQYAHSLQPTWHRKSCLRCEYGSLREHLVGGANLVLQVGCLDEYVEADGVSFRNAITGRDDKPKIQWTRFVGAVRLASSFTIGLSLTRE